MKIHSIQSTVSNMNIIPIIERIKNSGYLIFNTYVY